MRRLAMVLMFAALPGPAPAGVHSPASASCGRFDPGHCFSFDVGVGEDLRRAIDTLEARP